ncbi:MAG: M20/M25/M40 family metallo-hydrolase, partial [Patescibacteria group bacterium]
MREVDGGRDAIDVVNLCSELVLLPSVTDGEHELSPLIYLEKLFQKYRVSYEVITGSEKKKSIVATIGSGEPSVMLNSHFDVVPVPSPSLFHPRIEGSRLYGRGSADAKGPLSAMFTSFLSFRDEEIKGKIVLCAVCDEENAGTFGTKVVAERGIRATYNIFGEPTDFEVIIAEKGFLRLSISCTGKEAHAAFPDNGINAIRLASNIIQDIEEMSWNVPHQLLSPPTISYGTIDGGSKINVVAGKCKLTIDMRYLPGQDETELVEMFSQLAQRQGDCVVEVISSGP